MWVKIIQPRGGTNLATGTDFQDKDGDVIEVDDDAGRRMIDEGQAVETTEPEEGGPHRGGGRASSGGMETRESKTQGRSARR